MTEKLTDYEYSILDEVRRDEINQAIEKAEKYDEQKYHYEKNYEKAVEYFPTLTEKQYEEFSSLCTILTWIANELSNQNEQEQQIKQLKDRSVFIKCKLPECFPEHKYIEKDSIFYCEKLPDIGEVNWD